MGWLGDFMEKIGSAPAKQQTFARTIAASHLPGTGHDLVPDACYIEFYLESLRLAKARRFMTRFHGLAYSFVGLPRLGSPSIEFAAVSKPDRLAGIDKEAVGQVITVSKQMMGATAYRGGRLALEFGLFSVKSGNLLTPVMDYLARVSSVAGISYVDAVKPFLPLVTEGMDLLTGQVDDVLLEVGVDSDLDLTKSGASAVIAAPAGSIDTRKLRLDDDGVLLLDGRPLQHGYAVFSIRHTLQKADYGEIPELKDAFAVFIGAIRAGNYAAAKDAFVAFRLAVIACPDLITSDADTLIAKAKSQLDRAFPRGGTAGPPMEPPETLGDIGLYD
jgi:hypothetical protein